MSESASQQLQVTIVDVVNFIDEKNIRKAKAGCLGMLQTGRIWMPFVAGEQSWGVVEVSDFFGDLVFAYSQLVSGSTAMAKLVLTGLAARLA